MENENLLSVVIWINFIGMILLVLGALFQFCVPHAEMGRKMRAAVSLSCFLLGAMFLSGNGFLKLIAFGLLLCIFAVFIIWGFCRMLCSFFPALPLRIKKVFAR